MTIAEVLPLLPSRTIGNVGHKHKSQATQHGQNLSHIDAYSGEEKVHMEKSYICSGHEARKVIILSFSIRSPQVQVTYMFKDVCVDVVRSGCTEALKQERRK